MSAEGLFSISISAHVVCTPRQFSSEDGGKLRSINASAQRPFTQAVPDHCVAPGQMH